MYSNLAARYTTASRNRSVTLVPNDATFSDKYVVIGMRKDARNFPAAFAPFALDNRCEKGNFSAGLSAGKLKNPRSRLGTFALPPASDYSCCRAGGKSENCAGRYCEQRRKTLSYNLPHFIGSHQLSIAFHGNNNNNSNRYKNREESYQRRMVDITRDKPIKVSIRVVVPVRDHPKFNFVGKLLGPKGNSLKRLQEETMTKMAILGRGSMRDRLKEEELRSSGDARFGHLLEDLHVEITAFAPPAEAHARIAYALSEVRRFLVPDHNDEIRQEQMWEMQILNTSPTSSTNTLNSAAGGSRNSNDCGTSGLSLENGKENNGGSTCGSATGSDMLMNGGSGGIGSGSSTAAAAMNLLAASGTAGPGQLNLENLAANLQQHGFASLSNNISQTNGGSMEFGTATSSNGSLTPPELTNPISSPFSKAYKTKSPGVGGNAMTGRKRPLLTASSGADMMAAGPMAAVAAAAGPTGAAGPLFLSPTKRTVLSILARAKAAQNQHPIAAAVAASAYKHRPPPPPHPHHISAHHGLAGMAAPFHKNNLYGNPTNLLLN